MNRNDYCGLVTTRPVTPDYVSIDNESKHTCGSISFGPLAEDIRTQENLIATVYTLALVRTTG